MSFLGQVTVYCEAEVAGQRVYVSQVVPDIVWSDPVAREAIKESVRAKLMYAILEKWTPVVKVRG